MPTDWVICVILSLVYGVCSKAGAGTDRCLSVSPLLKGLQNVTMCSSGQASPPWPTINCTSGHIIIDDVVVGVGDATGCNPSPSDHMNSGKCLMTSALSGKVYRRVIEDLLTECSGKTSCTIQNSWTLPVILQNGTVVQCQYAIIYYMCEEAIPNLDFCKNSELQGENIYLKFSSETISGKQDVDCVCDVENTGAPDNRVEVTAFDVRLYPSHTPDNCIGTSLDIQGRQRNGSQCGALLNTVISSVDQGHSVSLVLHHVNASNPPSYVWLKITGRSNSSVLINCQGVRSGNPEAASVFLIAIVVTCVTTLAVIIIIVVVCIYRWRHQFKCLHRKEEVEQPVYFEVEPTTQSVETKPPLPPSNSSTIIPPPKPLRAHQLPSPTQDDSTARRKHYPHTELPPVPNEEEQYDLLLKQRSPTSPGNVYGGFRQNGKPDENPYAMPGEKHPRGRSVTEDKYDKPDLLKS